MLAHRLRRWPNIKASLFQYHVFPGWVRDDDPVWPNVDLMLAHLTVYDAVPALNQHWFSCLSIHGLYNIGLWYFVIRGKLPEFIVSEMQFYNNCQNGL